MTEEQKPTQREKLVLIGAVVVSVLVGGFVIEHLWAWFVVPLSVRPIGLAHACGLDALWFAFTPGGSFAKAQTPTVKAAHALERILYRTTVALAIGYIAHVVMR